jgi:hypothetical protein
VRGISPGALRCSLRHLPWRARRDVPTETIANLKDFVFGAFKDQGMPDFTGKLKDEDVARIQVFIQGTADAIRPEKD